MNQFLSLALAFGATFAASGGKGAPNPAAAPTLTVSIALESTTITEPFPARIILHFHNAGAAPLWLYRHVRDPMEVAEGQRRLAEAGERASSWTTGGSSLAIDLEPTAGAATSSTSPPPATEPAQGMVLSSIGLPHPRLTELMPGADEEEGAVVRIDPERVTREGHEEPVWGHYRLSVSYGAQYSNGDALSRDLGVQVWQGKATSNALDADLEPAPASAHGSVSGRVTREDGQPLRGMLVSLSDHDDHLAGQMTTDVGGQFSFSRLPWGLYWATARRPLASSDTAVYDHADLEEGDPFATVNLVMLERESYEPKQLLHKPVLLRVTGDDGRPLGGTMLEVLWSSGTVTENVKGETSDDGTVALDLLPGRNYVTLKRHKCPSEDRWVDVSGGGGIDGFSLTFDCK